MEECVEIGSSDDEPQHVERGSRESERIGISSASSSPHPPTNSERSNTPVSANLRNSNQIANRARFKDAAGQLKKLEVDPKFLANFNPQTSRREKRKLNRKTSSAAPKNTGLYNDKGVHRESGRDMCDCLDMNCPGCHFPCQCCGSTRCGPHCRVNRKWMYETIEHDAKDLIIRNKLMIKR
ncbi:ARL14 effector protein [Sabethes cyaneus]|uniref:ARL14 effector protein n=1 Tax=Sabethes cyaneus TaxID=53552 RepID=UPI00237DBBD3|nr:ARL14 effector protein [Sabethes cyaneus]XP_053684325.1 ARL14 effector protein [Sabethes cyaneus]XP_053684326.1 ARL14 effector protein [Sabethes cyaneus]